MRIEPLAIDGVLLITLDRFSDSRGYFSERYHRGKWAELGFTADFVQDNYSRSTPRVVRGIHVQHQPQQGKLVGVTQGAIYDVAVDLRLGSPSFGQHIAVELSEENNQLLWIPEGFGHGFCVLGDRPADVTYKVSGAYNPKGESGVRFDDPDLSIRWPISLPIISTRDADLPSLSGYIAQLKGMV
jgi:dTDP-4-dehydrorhamnose 3,5-epimerase